MANSLAAVNDAGKVIWRSSSCTSRFWLCMAAISAVASAIFAGLAPLALLALVDSISHSRHVLYEIEVSTITYVGALALQRFFGHVAQYTFGRGENILLARVNLIVFEQLVRSHLQFHIESHSGSIMQTMANSNRGTQLFLHGIMFLIIQPGLQLVTAAFFVGARLGVPTMSLFALVMIIYIALSIQENRAIARDQQDLIDSGTAASALLADTLVNVETIKAFSAEHRTIDKYGRLLEKQSIIWHSLISHRFFGDTWKTFFFGATIGLTLAVSGSFSPGSVKSIGSIVLLCAYVLQLLQPLDYLGAAAREINDGAFHLKGIGSVLQTPVEEVAGARRLSSDLPLSLVAENVSFRADNGRFILKDISFNLSPGSTIGIVGPSGAGKSTLLRLIMRFLEPSSGGFLVDGVCAADMSLNELRSCIALISQDVVLFNDSIGENIKLAAADASEEELWQAAKVARLDELLARSDDGMATEVGERGLRLSGGEKQRVSIARAALKKAGLLLFDEPTAALDAVTEGEVWSEMRSFADGASAIIVTHRLSTLLAADEILVLDEGCILQRGRHADLIERSGLYQRLWREAGYR